MNSILNNPYRILGLLANASAREINTRANRLRMGIPIPLNDDYGFPVLMGYPDRTSESVDKAKSELNLDKDKVENALFWFWKNNDISDEAAFDALKEGDTDTAIEIWQKLTDKGEVTERNSSAFLNLSTLLLYLSTNRKTVKKEDFEKGLHLKIQFLESRFSEEFVKKIGGDTCVKNAIELELLLLNQIRHDLEKAKGLTSTEMVGMLSEWAFAAKDKFLKEFSNALTKDITDKVKTCSNKRNKTPEEAGKLADELYNSVNKDLLQLKKMLGENNITYSNVADEVAEEILQCSSNLLDALFLPLMNIINKSYSKTIDSAKNMLAEAKPILHKLKTNIGSKYKRNIVLTLKEKARSIAIGHSAKQRCEADNEESDLNTIYLNMSTRIAYNALALILEEVKNSSGMTQQRRNSVIRMFDEMLTMDLTPDYRKTIEEIKGQINDGGGDPKVNKAIDILMKLLNEKTTITTTEVEVHLQIAKNALGKNNDTYLQISSAIANKILGDHIAVVNAAQEYINNAYDKMSALRSLRDKIGSAMVDMLRLEGWDLTSDFRSRLKTNKTALMDLARQLENIGSGNAGGGGVRKSSSGCYIATMAYGDYDHPQVLELRRFRDDVLAQSVVGRLFIQTYYYVSPKLVELLKGHRAINSFIRNILNQFIKIIKTK